MRFLLYNLRYGTGGSPLFRIGRYFRRTVRNTRRIRDFIASLDPDIVGLVEVDFGSYRTGYRNQAQLIARDLGHYHVYRSKYSEDGLARLLPVLGKQGNAFLSRNTIANQKFHYFERGVKRLVIELELENVTLFLVHLALTFRARHQQLGDLYTLVKEVRKPRIVAGDFNARWGEKEMSLFMAATGLRNATPPGLNTFPGWAPKRQLDFVLYSPEIRVQSVWAPPVTLSDHLPVVCDFEVAAAG